LTYTSILQRGIGRRRGKRDLLVEMAPITEVGVDIRGPPSTHH
jgi:hypothetical protein